MSQIVVREKYFVPTLNDALFNAPEEFGVICISDEYERNNEGDEVVEWYGVLEGRSKTGDEFQAVFKVIESENSTTIITWSEEPPIARPTWLVEMLQKYGQFIRPWEEHETEPAQSFDINIEYRLGKSE